jgi:pyrroline-5-carboxylate reductase
VSTPGGLTAQGVAFFEENKISQLLAEGMAESIRRGYELAR